jgi:hypothetical protein
MRHFTPEVTLENWSDLLPLRSLTLYGYEIAVCAPNEHHGPHDSWGGVHLAADLEAPSLGACRRIDGVHKSVEAADIDEVVDDRRR